MHEVVGLIFSKDRAMQLDATLRSFSLHCRDMGNIDFKVIWTYSNSINEQQYQELASTYPSIEFISELNFESQVLASIAGYAYVLFLVDDNIFVRDFSMENVIESLRTNQDALGFSLRLGINTNSCHLLRLDQQLPTFMITENEFLKYDWTSAQYDFAYPLEVSSSVYRVNDIMAAVHHSFADPTMLEVQLNRNKKIFYQQKKFLLCNQYSYTFCNFINRVHTIVKNQAGETFYYSTEQLSEMFIQGHRINVEEYNSFIPNACHQVVELKFKKITDLSRASKNKTEQIFTADSRNFQGMIPKVSVIMPVYNAEDYLSQAIESILGQTFTDFEFIIIDDGSTDNSLNIIKTYNDSRIILIRNETNLKLIASLNKGMNLANGKYIARMDADDISLPERLARQVEFMDQHPNVAVCGTWVELFGECEQSFWHFPDNPDVAKCVLLFGCCIAHPSAMLRRTILETGLCYSDLYPHAEDYGFWVQIAKKFDITSLPQVLLKYRISGNQKSAKDAQQVIDGAAKIQLEQINALGIEPTEQECLLHWTISQKQFIPNVSFTHAVLAWLTKLKEANSFLHYYPEPAFSEILRMYWSSVCINLVNAFK
ncbi:glycosyltransferase [Pelosinus sp. UFO1]|uniref:glycosyltransferase family 2 protein n=1 Tax=Pelosinus sp. UFO1 TaxID=484770 RepID=UPI0004D164D4|nr:glycosyltransferase [Pelosinus sp. UFO1]AIF50652.1 glycosyl transferase family 2 [Pelosinus sp. UFO1]